MQNENRNTVKEELQKPVAMKASSKIEHSTPPEHASNERAAWIEMREEDPERWDGLS